MIEHQSGVMCNDIFCGLASAAQRLFQDFNIFARIASEKNVYYAKILIEAFDGFVENAHI